ncbi:transposase [Micromonospora sp. M12]
MKYYAGLDWGESHHDVAVIDDDGQLISHLRLTDDADGPAQLLAALAAVRPNRRSIPTGIETGRGLMVAGLRKAGQPVVVLNPTQVANYRSRLARSGRSPTGATPACSRTSCASTATPTVPYRHHRPRPPPCEMTRATARRCTPWPACPTTPVDAARLLPQRGDRMGAPARRPHQTGSPHHPHRCPTPTRAARLTDVWKRC